MTTPTPDVTHAEILDELASSYQMARDECGVPTCSACQVYAKEQAACLAGAQALRDQVALRSDLGEVAAEAKALLGRLAPHVDGEWACEITDSLYGYYTIHSRKDGGDPVRLAECWNGTGPFLAQSKRLVRSLLSQVEALQRDQVALREQEQQIRHALWVNHGCPTLALYGDDGEMQCNAMDCRLDFKREPLPTLLLTLMARGRLHAGLLRDQVALRQTFDAVLAVKNRWEMELLEVFAALGEPPTVGYEGAAERVAALQRDLQSKVGSSNT